jgi:hypothetical protein
LGFRRFEGTPALRTVETVRADGGKGSLGWPCSTAQTLFRSDQRQASDNGCSRSGRVGLCVAVRNHADSLLLGRYGRCLRGASRGFLEREGFGAVPLTARTASVGSSNEASESIVSGEVLSFVGVLGFALTRLQNLTSGVWLKKPASVVAEAVDGA